MHNLKLILMSVLLAFALTLGACSKPESKLGSHLENLTEIMDDNMSSPADGIDKLREYLHKNLPDMAEQLGKLVVELESMESESDIKERLTQMKENLDKSLKDFEAKSKEFTKKAMGDEKAQKKIQEIQDKWAPIMMGFSMMGAMMGGGM